MTSPEIYISISLAAVLGPGILALMLGSLWGWVFIGAAIPTMYLWVRKLKK